MERKKIGKLFEDGAILDIKDGNHGAKHPKGSDFISKGVPFIVAQNIKDGNVDFGGCSHISHSQARTLKKGRAIEGDVLLTHKGTVGSTAIVGSTEGFIMLSPQVTYYRVNNSKLYNRYLRYAFMEPHFQAQLLSYSAQSTRPYISISSQRDLEVCYCPPKVQYKIATILSAYDDLIENNLRRIKILEEMAQLLYREWFVNFRFPGHDKVRMVDSILGKIPENWTAKKLGDIVELLYGKALREEDRKEGVIPVVGSSGVVGRHDEALVTGPGVVVGRKGNVGSVHWIDEDFWPIDTVFYASTQLPLPYVFFNLRSQGFINSDSAVPGLSRHQAYALPILCPKDSIVDEFAKIASDLFATISIFEAQNANLRQTRDLLLPKLISGQLDVTGLDIKVSEDLG